MLFLVHVWNGAWLGIFNRKGETCILVPIAPERLSSNSSWTSRDYSALLLLSVSLSSCSSPALLSNPLLVFVLACSLCVKVGQCLLCIIQQLGWLEIERERGRERSLMRSQGCMQIQALSLCVCVCFAVSCQPVSRWLISRSRCSAGRRLSAIIRPQSAVPSRPCSTQRATVSNPRLPLSLPLPMAPFPTIMAQCTFLSGCLLHSSVGGSPCRKTAPGGQKEHSLLNCKTKTIKQNVKNSIYTTCAFIQYEEERGKNVKGACAKITAWSLGWCYVVAKVFLLAVSMLLM